MAIIKKQNKKPYAKKLGISVLSAIICAIIVYGLIPKEKVVKQLDDRQQITNTRIVSEKEESDKKSEDELAVENKKANKEKGVAEIEFNSKNDEESKEHFEEVLASKKEEEERKVAEKKAAEERALAEQQAAQEAQIIAEKNAFQNWEETINLGINAVDGHWENLWQYTLTSAANGSVDAQTVFQNLRELEHKLIDDEMIFKQANVPKEMSQKNSKKMNLIKQGFATWAKLRRQGCEKFRLAFMRGNINQQVMQESLTIINQADAFMLRSTAELVELENEINNR